MGEIKNIVCPNCNDTREIFDNDATTGWVCGNCENRNTFNAPDPINSPPHYIFGPYELRKVLDEWVDTMDIPKSEACDWFSMMQYLFRYPRKGKPGRDLDKAMRYLKWIRERYE